MITICCLLAIGGSSSFSDRPLQKFRRTLTDAPDAALLKPVDLPNVPQSHEAAAQLELFDSLVKGIAESAVKSAEHLHSMFEGPASLSSAIDSYFLKVFESPALTRSQLLFEISRYSWDSRYLLHRAHEMVNEIFKSIRFMQELDEAIKSNLCGCPPLPGVKIPDQYQVAHKDLGETMSKYTSAWSDIITKVLHVRSLNDLVCRLPTIQEQQEELLRRPPLESNRVNSDDEPVEQDQPEVFETLTVDSLGCFITRKTAESPLDFSIPRVSQGWGRFVGFKLHKALGKLNAAVLAEALVRAELNVKLSAILEDLVMLKDALGLHGDMLRSALHLCTLFEREGHLVDWDISQGEQSLADLVTVSQSSTVSPI